jgi:hypothetical protein
MIKPTLPRENRLPMKERTEVIPELDEKLRLFETLGC